MKQQHYSGVCPWQLSGPQLRNPATTIQQRYCYPKGNPRYSNIKGGTLWTMLCTDRKEDVRYRLLHVYQSAKRAASNSSRKLSKRKRTRSGNRNSNSRDTINKHPARSPDRSMQPSRGNICTPSLPPSNLSNPSNNNGHTNSDEQTENLNGASTGNQEQAPWGVTLLHSGKWVSRSINY